MVDMETKYFGGRIVETKVEDRNGVPVGILAGHIATWDPDLGGRFGVPERFHRGAFLESINDHKRRNNRQVRLKDLHGRVIGGFPIETVVEDEKGLFGRGEVNLTFELGRAIHSLAQQRVLTDFSVGFGALDDRIERGVREIFKANLFEGSVVDEPMNQDALITEVKSVVPFQDLPLTDRERSWDAAAAKKRVREFTDSEDSPSPAYRKCFVWYDREEADSFGAYKLPIADVVDGSLRAVPRAIFAAAGAVSGARGGVDIPESDRAGVIRHLEKYYAKMDVASPFEPEERQFYGIHEVKEFSRIDCERALLKTGKFSRGAARTLSSRIVTDAKELGYDSMREILDDLREAKRLL